MTDDPAQRHSAIAWYQGPIAHQRKAQLARGQQAHTSRQHHKSKIELEAVMHIATSLKRATQAASVCTALLFTGAAAQAQSDTVFDGSKARVNLSNKLLMLTQSIGSASCRINGGIDVETALEELKSARSDFNTILTGLEIGGDALGIPAPEKHGVVINSIAEVLGAWAPIDDASERLLAARGGTGTAGDVIAQKNLLLLEATKILASDISGKYSNPHELTQADAMALNIAGRQRMLGHQIAKEVCGIAVGSEDLGSPDTLAQTMDLYAISLKALREGLVNAGVNPPPNEAIATELEAVDGIWQGKLSSLNSIRGGAEPSSEIVESVAMVSNELMVDMSNIVTLYMLSTPGQEDVYRVPLQSYAERELTKWLENPALIDAIKAQNSIHANLTQEQIDQLDLDWRAQRELDEKPLIDQLLEHPSSEWLRAKQAETANFVTEVFAMDNRGLNVAQSVETSDYWQGDEGKWQQTFGNGSGAMHISEVEFDESTGSYQSQVSMAISDPDTGNLIGAITFGINVQSLL